MLSEKHNNNNNTIYYKVQLFYVAYITYVICLKIMQFNVSHTNDVR